MARSREGSEPDPGRLLRPFAMTGGRARRRHDQIEVEALAATTWLGETTRAQALEQRSIALLCREPQSIAEISALMRLPLGVVRVLVGDMADQGLLELHRPGQSGVRPDRNRDLLERVLDGLRRI
jgi:Protein of unknown function (DUF742)